MRIILLKILKKLKYPHFEFIIKILIKINLLKNHLIILKKIRYKLMNLLKNSNKNKSIYKIIGLFYKNSNKNKSIYEIIGLFYKKNNKN